MHAARGRLLVPQGDPNEGEELEKANRKEAGAPYRHAESPFPALAAARRMAGASRGAPGGPAGQAPGDDCAPRRARTCGKNNGTKAGIRGGTAIAPGGKRAARAAADSSGPQRNDRGERMTEKRKLKRGFAGARMLADADARRVLALVTDEKTGGAPAFEALDTEAAAAPGGAAARGEARGKEAEEESAGAAAAEEKEEAAAAIAAEAVRSAPGEAAAARGRRRGRALRPRGGGRGARGRRRRRRDGPRAGAGGVGLRRRGRGGRGVGGEGNPRRRRVRAAQERRPVQ